MYHAWKSKNKKRNTETEQRAPKSVTDYGKNKSVLLNVPEYLYIMYVTIHKTWGKIFSTKFLLLCSCDLLSLIQPQCLIFHSIISVMSLKSYLLRSICI